jgi:hypothetical protein
VTAVTDRWRILLQGVATGNLDAFTARITNCNLDTGEDVVTGRLVCWA